MDLETTFEEFVAMECKKAYEQAYKQAYEQARAEAEAEFAERICEAAFMLHEHGVSADGIATIFRLTPGKLRRIGGLLSV